MKKRIKTLLLAGLIGSIVLSMTACDKTTPATDTGAAGSASTAETPDDNDDILAEKPDSTESEVYTIYASEIYDYGGFREFRMNKDNVIEFTLSQSAVDNDLTWTAYVLNEEFDDALRYLSQYDGVVQTLEMRGGDTFTLNAKKGQYIYLGSSENAFTLGGIEEVNEEDYISYTITEQ